MPEPQIYYVTGCSYFLELNVANVVCLRCRECKREFPVEPGNVCDFCFGPLEVVYDYSAIKKIISRKRIESGPFNLWRYQDLLPVDAANAIDINAGFTPGVCRFDCSGST